MYRVRCAYNVFFYTVIIIITLFFIVNFRSIAKCVFRPRDDRFYINNNKQIILLKVELLFKSPESAKVKIIRSFSLQHFCIPILFVTKSLHFSLKQTKNVRTFLRMNSFR
jgi:hypothetical protein